MNSYIPSTSDDIKQMMGSIGINKLEDLFQNIPENIKLNNKLNINSSMSELELKNHISKISKKNKSAESFTNFLGAGTYDHFIPSTIKHLTSRSEFYTAYTPYQPEISQGTLQALFEYQTMICDLTDLEISNASVYDGATACAEAAIIATTHTRLNKILVSKTVNPETRKVLQTYMRFKEIEIIEIDMNEGATNLEDFENKFDNNTAGVIVQNPNFFGVIEDYTEVEKLIHKTKSLMIMSVDPISLGILKTPGEIGADIAVGDGQGLGNEMNFGGPHLGFMSAKTKFLRKMPGRIIGQTEDIDNQRGYVLTIQTREQHIKRQKATSNICSNQSLNALAAAIYLASIGKNGLKTIATQCLNKSHYTLNNLIKNTNYLPLFKKPFFKEFAIKSKTDSKVIENKLMENKILGGYNLNQHYSLPENSMLFAVTEKRTKKEIDNFISVMDGIK